MATTARKPKSATPGRKPPKEPEHEWSQHALVIVVMLPVIALGAWWLWTNQLSAVVAQDFPGLPLHNIPPFNTPDAWTVAGCAAGAVALIKIEQRARDSAYQRKLDDYHAAQALTRVLGAPAAQVRVHSRDRHAPTDVTVRGTGRVDENQTARLRDEFARLTDRAPHEVRADKVRDGIRLRRDQDARPPEPDVEPDAEPGERLLHIAEGALVGPGKTGLTLETIETTPDGTPTKVMLHYSPNLSNELGEKVANLMRLLNETVPTTNGRWAVTWKPQEDAVLVVDEPDLLAKPIPLQPLDPNLDIFKGVPLGLDEHGRTYRLPIANGAHVFIAGATRAGKGSYIWGLIRALSLMVEAGTCRLWVCDPKFGMELGPLEKVAYRYADTAEDIFELLAEAVEVLGEKGRAVKDAAAAAPDPGDDDDDDKRKLTSFTREMPFDLIIIDELNSIGTDPKYVVPTNLIMQMGAAAGMTLLGALQNPDTKSVSNRARYTMKIALRLSEAAQVPMVLGPGARAAGAFADSIPETMQGTAYARLDEGKPVRVRSAFVDYAEVRRIVKAMSGERVLSAPDLGPTPAGTPTQLEIDPAYDDPDSAVIVERAIPTPVKVTPKKPAPVEEPATVTPHVLAAMLGSTHPKGIKALFANDADPLPVLVKDVSPSGEEGRWEITYIYDGEPTSRVDAVDEDEQFIFV